MGGACTHTYLPSVQIRLAQVNQELHDRITSTPRYAALTELKENCEFELGDKEWDECSPAERLFARHYRQFGRQGPNTIHIQVPIPKVCAIHSSRCVGVLPHLSTVEHLLRRAYGDKEQEIEASLPRVSLKLGLLTSQLLVPIWYVCVRIPSPLPSVFLT